MDTRGRDCWEPDHGADVGGGVVLPRHSEWMGGDRHDVDGRRQRVDTCQRFVSGDASGGPRFKIDRYGQLAAELPGGRLRVNASTAYQIRIHASTQAVKRDGNCQLRGLGVCQYLAATQTRHLQRLGQPPRMTPGRGSPVAGGRLHGWRRSQRLQFDRGWRLGRQLWRQQRRRRAGEKWRRHLLDKNVGTVRIQVNDQTLAYSITPGDDNQPPLAVITPGQW